MRETKQASASPILADSGARAVLHEMMAAFEAFKGANDARLDEIEKKTGADVLLEEKVARIDQAVASAQARLDRAMSRERRPLIGGEPVETASAPEAKAEWDGYLKTGAVQGLALKAGLSSGATSGGYVVPHETERAIERRLMTCPTVADAGQAWGQVGYVASGAEGGFAPTSPADRLIDLIYAPKAQDRPNGRFVMNRKTVSAVRKFKDAEGNYIWQPATRLTETPVGAAPMGVRAWRG